MKTNKTNYLAALLMFFTIISLPAEAGDGTKTIEIKTSAQCNMCKETIEKALAFEKGVKSANLDVDSQIVTVTYKTKKTDAATIKKAIAKEGYQADEVPADERAYKKLPGCCKLPKDQ